MGKTFKDSRNKYRKGDLKKSAGLKKSFKTDKHSPSADYDDWSPKKV